MNILYISYDGLTDPLGRSQILPYLTGLNALGHQITVLSCEKKDALGRDGAAVREACQAAGIGWQPLTYHRSPPILSSIYDMAMLKRAAAALHRATPFDIVHCRSYIPAIVGLRLKRRFHIPMLFDMRGFWADERREGGSWDSANPLFRAVYAYFKRREDVLLKESDRVVSLTRNARTEMMQWPALAGRDVVTVIPCCVDFDHFRLADDGVTQKARQALGIAADRPVLAYLGSLGGNYLLDEMLDFFLAWRERAPGALFLFITRDDPAMIEAAAAGKSLGKDSLMIRAASRDEVPTFVAAADLGVAFKSPGFSAKACSPTKLGEMLAVGIPVVANGGVGDVEEIIAQTGAGVIVNGFDPETLADAAARATELRLTGAEIRDRALPWFNLDQGIADYDLVYQAMTRPGPAVSVEVA